MLTPQALNEIGNTMFGQQWRKELASALNLSYARVSQFAIGSKIPPSTAEKIIQLFNSWKEKGGCNTSVDIKTISTSLTIKDPEAALSDEEILSRINKRFGVMDRIIDGMLQGKIRSLIVSGAPGIGKTYNLERRIREEHRENHLEYAFLKGTCSAIGLYQALHLNRNGGIVVLDDCDSIFQDEQAFNILKAALDTTNVRTIAWRKQSSWVYDVNGEDGGTDEVIGERFPNEFEFEGAIVFITNLDLRKIADQGHRLSPHFNALLSRSMYLDLTLHTTRSKIIRIKDVFLNSMIKTEKLSINDGEKILAYVLENADRIVELSLRKMKHVCDLYKLGNDWQEICEYTLMKYPKELSYES